MIGVGRKWSLYQDDGTMTALVSRWRPSGTEVGAACGLRGMLLCLLVLLFQPESHGD